MYSLLDYNVTCLVTMQAKLSFSTETIRYYPDLETRTLNTILGIFSTVTAFQDADFRYV